MKDCTRSNEEKAYLVLQHLFELFTGLDPTNRNPYRMEQKIVDRINQLADDLSQSERTGSELSSNIEELINFRNDICDVLGMEEDIENSKIIERLQAICQPDKRKDDT